MGVYVDELFEWGGGYGGEDAAQAERVGAKNGHKWCHLFSDETDPAFPELIAFAVRIGLRRSWFQGDYFDLTPGRRVAAIGAGAKECTRAAAVAIWRRTPRARKRRCKGCGFVTEPTVEPLPACPRCGKSTVESKAIAIWPPLR